MDLHYQGQAYGLSPAYGATAAHAFPQPKNIDTKVYGDHGASQPSAIGVDKNAMAHVELVVHPKPEGDLPDYSGHAKLEKTPKLLPLVHAALSLTPRLRKPSRNPRLWLSLPPGYPLCQNRSRDVPTKLLLIPREPTAGHPYLFHARIKLDEALQDELESGVYDPRKRFLTQPIATGVWYGAHLTVAALEGHESQPQYFCNKVTWGEFLTELFGMHPTGAWRNLRRGEKDFFPKEDWEFYDVQVSLWMGAPVE